MPLCVCLRVCVHLCVCLFVCVFVSVFVCSVYEKEVELVDEKLKAATEKLNGLYVFKASNCNDLRHVVT